MKKAIEVINALRESGLIRDYAIGGAIGALRWVEPFFTRDLDIFVIPGRGPEKSQVSKKGGIRGRCTSPGAQLSLGR